MIISAKGTKIYRNGNQIAKLTVVGIPERTRDQKDVTNHDSTNNYEEILMTIKRTPEVNYSGYCDPSDTDGQNGLSSDYENGTLQSFNITTPQGFCMTFNAYVTRLKYGDAPVDDGLPISFSLKASGPPTPSFTYSNNCSNIVLSEGTLNPTFAGGTYVYVNDVATGVASLTITPTAAAGTITVKNEDTGTSEVVTSGEASGAITLGAAGTLTNVSVTVKESNKAQRKYDIVINRAAS